MWFWFRFFRFFLFFVLWFASFAVDVVDDWSRWRCLVSYSQRIFTGIIAFTECLYNTDAQRIDRIPIETKSTNGFATMYLYFASYFDKGMAFNESERNHSFVHQLNSSTFGACIQFISFLQRFFFVFQFVFLSSFTYRRRRWQSLSLFLGVFVCRF